MHEVKAVERTCLLCNPRVGNLNAGRATFTSQTTTYVAVQHKVQIAEVKSVAQGAQLNLGSASMSVPLSKNTCKLSFIDCKGKSGNPTRACRKRPRTDREPYAEATVAPAWLDRRKSASCLPGS